MNGLGDQLFSSSRFASYHHGDIGTGRLFDIGEDFFDRRALADDALLKVVFLLYFLLEGVDSGFERNISPDILDRRQQSVANVIGLSDIIVSAHSYQVYCRTDVILLRNNDHFDLRVECLNFFKHFLARHIGESVVKRHREWLLGLQCIERIFGRAEFVDLIIRIVFQGESDELSIELIVFNHKYSGTVGFQIGHCNKGSCGKIKSRSKVRIIQRLIITLLLSRKFPFRRIKL